MQQIINFVIRHRNTLLFLFLLFISIGLTIQSHSYHKSKFISSTNFISGSLYQATNNISDYFYLKGYNNRLLEENAKLKNQLSAVNSKKDLEKGFIIDTLQRYSYTPAEVINSTYHKTKNYITINKGSKDSIFPDMGVATDNGIIGIVESSSENYSRIISILNKGSKINAQLKKSNHFGSLVWNGNATNIVQLIDIPRLAPLKIGDTIITGGRSTIFPKGVPIGEIINFELNIDQSYFTVNIRLFNDMTNIGFVNVIKNLNATEIKNLEAIINE